MTEVPNEPVVGEPPPKANVLLSNKVYDVLKWICLVFLPAFGALYLGLGAIWENLPDADPVVKTVVLFETFLGILLGITNRQYTRSPGRYSGQIVFEDTGGKEPDVNLVLNQDARDFEHKDQVIFKVRRRRR